MKSVCVTLLAIYCYLPWVFTSAIRTFYWQENGASEDEYKRHRFTTAKQLHNDLRNATKIEIYNLDVAIRVLEEEAFYDYPFLETLHIVRNDIEELRPGCFKNVSKLSTLVLSGNRIVEIKDGIFNGLNLITLSLQGNRITTIDTNAFDNMPRLYRLDLSYNRIAAIDNSWFYNTPNLTFIDLSSNNISELPPLTFKNIQRRVVFGNETREFSFNLGENKIKHIDPRAFRGFREIGDMLLDDNEISEIHEDVFAGFRYIRMLSLINNNLRTLPDKMFDTGLKAVNGTVNLAVNKWNCDFRIKYKKWTHENGKNNDLVGDWWCYDKHSIY